MPSIQDLEQFRSSFRNIGGEATARAEKGLPFEDLPLPEDEGIDASMASLLGADSEDAAPLDAADAEAGGESPDFGQAEGEAFDFSAFLDSIPDNLDEKAPESGAEEPAGAPEDEFGLPAGLIDGLADEIEEVGEESPDAEEPATFDAADFDLGIGELPGEAVPETPLAETMPEAPSGAEDFSDFDFDIPAGFETGETPAQEEALPDAALPEADEEGFELPAQEDGFAEELAEETIAPEEPGIAGAEESMESFDLFTEEAPEQPETTEIAEEAEDLSFAGPDESEAGGDFSVPDFSFDEADAAGGGAEEGGTEEIAFEEAGGGVQAEADDFGAAGDFGAGDFGGPGDFDAAGAFGDGLGEDDAANAPIDSFDTFSLDDDFSAADFGGGAQAEGGGKPDDFAVLEDFSLDGIDDVFKSGQAAAPKSAPKGRTAGARGGRPVPSAGEVEEINLSEEDFARLQETLSRYPLNLRIACEELIAEHAVPPDQMSALVKMLVKGTPARETAGFAGRLIGRSIVIPKGFEKSSGAALEAERNTFAYAFVHNILPVLRIFALAAVATASLVYLGFEFVYKPLRAEYLYGQGEKSVLAGDYARGNDRFEEAGTVWRKKKWHYRYAEAFIDMKQYLLAEEKYDQLLRWYPRDKKGALDYASLETYVLMNYEKADAILRHQILDWDAGDADALLAQGDNNLAWGDYDPARYEEARVAYARLMDENGRKDEFLERMLLYFIRTDNLAEILPLQEHFLQAKKAKISAPALSELSGYLLDKKVATAKGVPDPNIAKIENIKKLLLLAAAKDPSYPETYYHLTRYYEHYGQTLEERESAERALRSFDAYDKLPARRVLARHAIRPNQALRWTKARIDTHRRLASLFVREREFMKAEETLGAGIDIYEDALAKRVLPRTGDFGRLYADLGDIEYFVAGDLDAAAADYREAVRNGWDRPEIRYRLGYVGYAKEQWEGALVDFFKASQDLPLNRRMLFALGNALYRRGDLHAAQGYYTRLNEMLETERGRFRTLVPNERPEHAELADRIMRVRNNLGVALTELAERNGDARYKSRALALYAESAQAWDALARDPKTMVRSGSTNLAYLNTRGSLYPTSRFVSQIYTEIDKDVLEPSFWEELLDR